MTTPANTIALHLTDHHQEQLIRLAMLLAFGSKGGVTLRAIACSYPPNTSTNAILVRLYQLESLKFVTIENRLNAPNLYHWNGANLKIEMPPRDRASDILNWIETQHQKSKAGTEAVGVAKAIADAIRNNKPLSRKQP